MAWSADPDVRRVPRGPAELSALGPNLLLTGAGFTHNFGAPLARGIWALIIGHRMLGSAPRVRELLLEEFDFERVYHRVMDGDEYGENEKGILAEAVADAYWHVDEILRAWKGGRGTPYAVRPSGVGQLIDSCARWGRGLIFTLNQDLFVERYGGNRTPILLGLGGRTGSPEGGAAGELQERDYMELPEKVPDLLSEIRKIPFAYVKLHGSWTWRSPRRRPRRTMVLGGGKLAQISAEPLLRAYHELFRQVLLSGGKRLLITGYGFGDAHVNGAIADGVEKAGLQVFILSPDDPEKVRKLLAERECPEIWSGLRDYFPYTLRELFPESQGETQAWMHVRRSFFDR